MAKLLDIDGGRIVTVATFYQASELLGVGRFSEVYKALDTHLQADVALKLYLGFDPKAHELAKNEESVLARLTKLNSEYFPKLRRSAKHRIKNQNHPLLVLELGTYVDADGQKRIMSLKHVIPELGTAVSKGDPEAGFWKAEALVRWAIHMVQAVKQLHEVNIVHRDFKPANILVKRGPGQSAPVPLFLDFNSAAASGDSDSKSGTPRYLPPEVTSGRRQTPSPADDLWAIATVAWELIHGQGASPDSACGPHALVTGSVPEAFIDVLRHALSINPESRFVDANELLKALEAAAAPPLQAGGAPALGSDEVVRARTAMERIRRAIGEAMAPPGEIFIPKEIHDAVTTVIAWLSQEDTQSMNLVDEIVRLGPIAIPVCLQQGYRLQRASVSYSELLAAIAELGEQDPSLAHRSIDTNALSSNIGVRALCWRACEELRYFPEILLDSLAGDEGILLPEERLTIADLCIRFSRDTTVHQDAGYAVLALVKYMCREYILDHNRYTVLCSTVARRMNELQFRKTARLIAEDAQNYVWEDLKEFEKLSEAALDETERGLIELMAEAFAATDAAGLEVLKSGKVQRRAGKRGLPVFRRFAIKLGASNPEARSWLVQEASRNPGDKELQNIVKKLGKQNSDQLDSPDTVLGEYLRSEDRRAFDSLRFWSTAKVLDLVNARLSATPSLREVGLVLRLLRGYQNRKRPTVVDIVLKHWAKLAGCDYDAAVDVLTDYQVPPGLHQQAVDILSRDLIGAHESAARRGLVRLLG